MANRKHSKIDNLPEDLKSVVETMLQSDATYTEIVDFLKENEQSVSVASVVEYDLPPLCHIDKQDVLVGWL